jgi:hypothetical protein
LRCPAKTILEGCSLILLHHFRRPPRPDCRSRRPQPEEEKGSTTQERLGFHDNAKRSAGRVGASMQQACWCDLHPLLISRSHTYKPGRDIFTSLDLHGLIDPDPVIKSLSSFTIKWLAIIIYELFHVDEAVSQVSIGLCYCAILLWKVLLSHADTSLSICACEYEHVKLEKFQILGSEHFIVVLWGRYKRSKDKRFEIPQDCMHQELIADCMHWMMSFHSRDKKTKELGEFPARCRGVCCLFFYGYLIH